MQDRGLAAYIAELLGTFFLVFGITLVGVLFIAVGDNASFGSDFAVVGLTYAFILTALIFAFGGASGGHFNPAITLGAALMKKIAPVDAVIYILAQLSGGVLGALLTKGLLEDEGRAANYGAVSISPLLSGNFAGAVVECLGTFLLVLVVLSIALGVRAVKDWAPLAIGLTLGVVGLILVPLTGGAVNPARWFGPALVSGEWGGVWPYLVGQIVGAVLAFVVYKFIIAPGAGGSLEKEAKKPSTIPSPEA